MGFRKFAAIILVLTILLTGCGKTATDDEGAQGEETAGVHTDENQGRDNTATEDEDAGEAVTDSGAAEDIEDSNESLTEGTSADIEAKAGGDAAEDSQAGENTSGDDAAKEAGETNGIIELIPMKELPDLNMDPQEPFTIEEIAGIGTSMLTPVYYDTLRYQIREFTRNPSRLVIDIGNTSNETLVITDKNMEFSILDFEGNNIAGSKVQGAPVSIAPGEIKRVVVTARNPDAGVVFFEFGGVSAGISCPVFRPFPNEAADITDSRPYDKYGYIIEDEAGNPFIVAENFRQVIGNGKIKAMSRALMIVENDRIGPLEKGDGFLSLVKVRIANTSDEVMRIDRLYTAGGGVYLDLTEEDLAVLGDMALPLTAEPHSIIEGWVPFRVREGREAYGIVFYTNLGNFMLGHLQTYPVYPDH